ncbi:MAG: SpoIIE family protein phosphatase [Candidatus Riflebacteria bacterium]|nr:SpoIIE family protein phosphatase [Candidatus Riflebacteria bacterium]
MAKATPVDYYKIHFQSLANKLFPLIENNENEITADTREEITKGIHDLSQNININIRCALFDKNAKLINPNNLQDYEIRFFTYAWESIHDENAPDYKNRRVDQEKIIGREFNVDLMYDQSEYCMPTLSLGKNGVFYFKNANSEKNGIILFVENVKTSIELVQAKIKDYSTVEQPIILYDLDSKKRISSTLGYKELPFAKTNTEEFLEGYLEDNIVWKGFNSDEYKLLLGQPLSNPQRYINKFINALIISFIILIIASKFFFKNFSDKEGMYISIRYKLVFLFALAVYMPTLSLWVLSYTSLNDYRTAIENKIKKGMLDVLNNIDFDYRKTEEEVKNSFIALDNYLNSFSNKEAPTSDEVYNHLKEIVGVNNRLNRRFNWIDIRNIDQTQIYTTSNEESNQRLEKICRVMSILCLERYCPERLTYAGIKPTQSDILVGNLFENPVVGFSSVFERPKQVVYQKFDGSGAYWWWNYFVDKNNPVAFYICNSQSKYVTVDYFKTLSKNRYNFENTNLRLVNMHFVTQTFIPEEASKNNEILELINLSSVNQTVESSNVTYENKKYLCLCMPGNNLKECFSLCMYPVSEIDYQVDKVRSAIYTVMILLLIISIFTGLLLAKTFITPVNELNKGLEALRKRETGITINIENQDELGQLGQAFNQMMSDIKDMLLAGAVQQCLIPTGKYKLEGYDCLVYNQMAADVGGDYADIFELPNDRILIVIGDVTGHGVSSSLLTAMVKASVFRFANKDTPLNEITTNTSNMIFDLLNKRKLMTFCAITLDKNTGEMAICNAGHPYPIIKAKEPGNIRKPIKTSLPLGISKKRCRYTSEPEMLNPEETLFIYTDGFPEAENDKGEEFTYEKFEELISNSVITTAEEFKNQLISVFKQHHGEKELADDVTFIILKRKALQI